MKICKKCNAKMEDNQNFCPVCGTPAEGKASQQSKGKKGKKQSKAAVIIATVAIIIVAAGGIMAKLFLLPEIEKSNTYKEAVACYSAKQYEQAQKLFETLGDYKDSKQKAEDSCLGRAEQFLSDGDYKNAREIVKQLGDSDSAKKMENQCDYEEAEGLVKQEDYEAAYKIFEQLAAKNYKDADVLAKQTLPKAAKTAYDSIINEYAKTEEYKEYGSYTYFDLEKDGVDELFLSTGNADLKVYSYQKGKLNILLEQYIGFYIFFPFYDSKSKILQIQTSGDDPFYDWYYKLSDQFKSIGTLHIENSDYVYKNGKKVTKYKNYDDVYKAIGFSKNAERIDIWH